MATPLLAELSADRDALLAIAGRVTDDDLALSTRNEGRTVRDELAHVVASDIDLIELLEAARDGREAHLDEQLHNEEMARWSGATPQAFVDKLRDRAARWGELLESLPDGALDVPARADWRPAPAPSRDVLADWRNHDAQHTEDIRLALADLNAGHGA